MAFLLTTMKLTPCTHLPLLPHRDSGHVEPAGLPAQVREANQMVEEMMLLANVTVAEHVLRAFPACALLRRHPTPPPRQFEPLLRAAAAAHVDIDTASSKVPRTRVCSISIVNRAERTEG